MSTLEVLFTPADFAALRQQNLADTVCVVFDVLRATSSMLTALHNGADAIIPVEEIPEALSLRQAHPDYLLAGERDGVRIRATQTGSIDFDLGNSPREFTTAKVKGRTIVITTTNGTRALRASSHASKVLLGSFLNLQTTADALLAEKQQRVLIVCSGTFDQASYEDVLGAGALCQAVHCAGVKSMADSALMALRLFEREQKDLQAAFASSRNGSRLLSIPELRDDVPFCLRRDSVPLLAALSKDGAVRCC